jgi:hypothetical protein
MIVLVGLALGSAAPASGQPADPPGELWIVASPATCHAGEPLDGYVRQVREQVDAAMRRLQRTPRMIATRAELLAALGTRPHGWLFLFLSGHGTGDGGSRVCMGDGEGEWLDINRDLLPALPATLSGAVIVLDSCSSAHVDPRLARIPTAILSASPNIVESGALFGAMVLASLGAASDENCSGAFDDDDLFTGLTRRLQSSLSLVKFAAWPKLRRNAPSPVPIAVRARSPGRCTELARRAAAIPPQALPGPLARQRDIQAALAHGGPALPHLDHDFFIAPDPDSAAVRAAAIAAGLVALPLGRDAATALAATTSFAEIYRFELSFGWLRTWRLRDDALVSVVHADQPACGIPSRTVASDLEVISGDVTPRYSQADRYLRDVRSAPPGGALACFESEGQCFNAPAARTYRKGCEP